MASALAVNLLSSLLAFLLGAAAQKLYERWRAITPARLVWRLGRPLDVVIAQADGPGHGTPLPTLYEGDAATAVIVSQFLQSVLGVPTPRIIRASTFAHRRDAHSDLVVIGGPNANGLYNEVARRVSMPYRFKLYPDRADMIRVSDGHVFAQEVLGAKTVRDFAVISFLPNPFDPARRMVILAGCGTQGCLAAAKMVTFDGTREMARLQPLAAPLSVVIEIAVIEGQMTRPQIIDTFHWTP
ncbi:MAG: hypothetical protein ACRDP6_13055 [Actinoallomurus sp.]